jgi:hypothetical protein
LQFIIGFKMIRPFLRSTMYLTGNRKVFEYDENVEKRYFLYEKGNVEQILINETNDKLIPKCMRKASEEELHDLAKFPLRFRTNIQYKLAVLANDLTGHFFLSGKFNLIPDYLMALLVNIIIKIAMIEKEQQRSLYDKMHFEIDEFIKELKVSEHLRRKERQNS